MRDIVKVRKVGDTLVVTLTQAILQSVELEEGDRLLLEASPPRRVTIIKEVETMPTVRRAELELEVLTCKRDALAAQAHFVADQNNLSMPVEAGMDDQYVVQLTMAQLSRDIANNAVDIAEKNLELFDLGG